MHRLLQATAWASPTTVLTILNQENMLLWDSWGAPIWWWARTRQGDKIIWRGQPRTITGTAATLKEQRGTSKRVDMLIYWSGTHLWTNDEGLWSLIRIWHIQKQKHSLIKKELSRERSDGTRRDTTTSKLLKAVLVIVAGYGTLFWWSPRKRSDPLRLLILSRGSLCLLVTLVVTA